MFSRARRPGFRLLPADRSRGPTTPLHGRVFRITAFKPDNVRPIPDGGTAAVPSRIRCPHCQWQPPRAGRWFCTAMGSPENFSGGCGHGWNTFDTRGACPGCSYQWKHTWCLDCGKPSLHDDWYVSGGGQP